METNNASSKFWLDPLPNTTDEALSWLLPLVRASDEKRLPKVPSTEFKRGWHSIGFLYPGLHPDSAVEHGTEISFDTEPSPDIEKVEPRLLAPFYVQSGWPVVLEAIAADAWRRYESGELKDDEFYCSEAVVAGMCHRNPELAEQVRQERVRSAA